MSKFELKWPKNLICAKGILFKFPPLRNSEKLGLETLKTRNSFELKHARTELCWFRGGGGQLRQELSDVEQAAGVKIICKNRGNGAGTARGGGVAFRL